MGMPQNEEPCPYDGACWLPGKTPKFIVATIHRIQVVPGYPPVPTPPNGMFTLEQVNEFYWTAYKNSWHFNLTLNYSISSFVIIHDLGYIPFLQQIDEPCQNLFNNGDYQSMYASGIVVIGWFGPIGSADSQRDNINQLCIANPTGSQVEMYGTANDEIVSRIANKYDHTMVYIKKGQ